MEDFTPRGNHTGTHDVRQRLSKTPDRSIVGRNLIRGVEINIAWINVGLVRHDRIDWVAHAGEGEPGPRLAVSIDIDARRDATEVVGPSTSERALSSKRAWSVQVPSGCSFPHARQTSRSSLKCAAAPLRTCRGSGSGSASASVGVHWAQTVGNRVSTAAARRLLGLVHDGRHRCLPQGCWQPESRTLMALRGKCWLR